MLNGSLLCQVKISRVISGQIGSGRISSATVELSRFVDLSGYVFCQIEWICVENIMDTFCREKLRPVDYVSDSSSNVLSGPHSKHFIQLNTQHKLTIQIYTYHTYTV